VLGEAGQARAQGFMGRGRGQRTWHRRLGGGRRPGGLPIVSAMDTVGVQAQMGQARAGAGPRRASGPG
jgi:hypothetical protein